MALSNLPANEKEVVDSAKADVKAQLPDSNPFEIKNSFLSALVTAFGARIFDFYRNLNELIRQIFVDTATGTFLERWGAWRNVFRNPSTSATGTTTSTGTNTTVIPANTELVSQSGLIYKTQAEVIIAGGIAVLTVKSVSVGQDTNLSVGAILSFVTPIAGANTDTTVDAAGIAGGTELEDDDSFRTRVIERYQNVFGQYSSKTVEAVAKTVPGVTRVFVFEPQVPEEVAPRPLFGQTVVYFMRDDDVDPLPSAGEVQDVKDVLDLIRPANTASADLIVKAPTGTNTAFTFTAINPATASMQTAIEDSLQQVFDEQGMVGEDLVEIAYQSAIFQTVDPVTGEKVISFTLSAPVGDISVGLEVIPTLGSVTF